VPSNDAETFWQSKNVLVTGAAGFIGSAISRQLETYGANIRALLEPGTNNENIKNIKCEIIYGDIRDDISVENAVSDIDVVFHTAAVYKFWAKDLSIFTQVNVGGTLNILRACSKIGISNLIYTSTVGTLGLHKLPADETSYADINHLFGEYKKTKYVAEHEVLRYAAMGNPAVLTQPTMPIGPYDRAPTPSGRLVLDYLNSKIPGYIDTVLNIVHVDDVAYGHLLAGFKGKKGQSYILGGENLSMLEILKMLAKICSKEFSGPKIPVQLAPILASILEIIQGKLLGKEPRIQKEAAKMSATKMAFNDQKARKELGYYSRAPILALYDAAKWFVENNYVIKPVKLIEPNFI
jgi:dihydroflavonol-4-reductase